jgi:O-antigen/teichoic acid export membrane protein
MRTSCRWMHASERALAFVSIGSTPPTPTGQDDAPQLEGTSPGEAPAGQDEVRPSVEGLGHLETEETHLLDRPQAGGAALRGSVLRSGAYVAGLLLSLVSAPLLTRHLGIEGFGSYVTVTALVTIVAGFTEGGLNAIVLKGMSTLDPAEQREMMHSAIGIRIVLTSFGVALATFFAIAVGYEQAMVIGTVLAGAGLVLQLLQSLFAVTLQSRLRFGWASAVELLRQFVSVTLIIALVLAGAGLVPLLAVAIPAAAVSLAATIPLVARYVPLTPSFHPQRWWSLLRSSIPWAAISAVNIVYLRVALVLMSLTAAALQTGYFALSFRVMEVLIGIPAIILAPAFPILARSEHHDRERFARVSGRVFGLALLLATWIVVCVEVGAELAIHILGGAEADPATAVLRIQALSLLGNFIAVACGIPLLTMGRHRQVLAANLLALVLSGALTLALAPSLGARGGAIAIVVGEIGLGSVSALLLVRALPRASLRLGLIPIAGLAGCAAVAIGLAVPISPILGTIVASAVFLLVLRLFRSIPPELRELVDGLGAMAKGRS